MSWPIAVIVYVLVWWLALFVVLPFGARPEAEPDPVTGWRGTLAQPRLARRMLATTILAAVIWLAIWFAVESGWLSFRDGLLAPPQD